MSIGEATELAVLAARADAPEGLAAWAATRGSLAEVWAACERADWLLWLGLELPEREGQERALVGGATAALRVSQGLRRPWTARVLRYRASPADVASDWSRGVHPNDVDVSAERMDDLTSAAILALVIGAPLEYALVRGASISPTGIEQLLWLLCLVLALPIFVVYQRLRLGARRRALTAFRYETEGEQIFVALRAAASVASPAERRLQAVFFRKRAPLPRPTKAPTP